MGDSGSADGASTGAVGHGSGATVSRRTRWVAYGIGAFGLGVNHQVGFLVPLRAHELGASFEIIGLIVAAGAVAPALFSVPVGAIIDRLGPRRSFMLGTTVTGCLALVFVLATDYWVMIALQFFLGLFRISAWVASQAYITSLGTERERVGLTGRFSFFSNVGSMLGPLLLGGISQLTGFRLAFLFVAAYSFAFAVLGSAMADTRPTGAPVRQGTGFVVALRLLAIRGMQVGMLFTFVRLWIDWIWNSFFPVFLVDSGLDPAVAGTVVFVRGLSATLLAPTTGFWARFVSKEYLTGIALGCGVVGLVLSPHLAFLPLVYLPPLLLGVGTGLSLPLLLGIVSGAAPADKRGIALGLRGSVNQVAGAGAPLLVGPLISALGIVLAFASGGGLAAALLVAAALLHRGDARAREGP